MASRLIRSIRPESSICSTSASSRIGGPDSFPAANASASRLAVHCWRSHGCCCWMSRWDRSTRNARRRSCLSGAAARRSQCADGLCQPRRGRDAPAGDAGRDAAARTGCRVRWQGGAAGVSDYGAPRLCRHHPRKRMTQYSATSEFSHRRSVILGRRSSRAMTRELKSPRPTTTSASTCA